MAKPTIRIYTSVDEFTDREMTDAEYKKHQADQAEFLAAQSAEETKAQAKAELLERLGITADEAKLLLA